MASTYNDEDLASSPKDLTRFLIGDTDMKDPLLTDGEITYLLSLYNNSPINAAIRACETIISKLSRLADESVGQVRINFSQMAKSYRDTLAMLRQRLATEDCTPYSGGISVADKKTNEMNKDRVRPDFTKHMMENKDIAPWVTNIDKNLWLNFED